MKEAHRTSPLCGLGGPTKRRAGATALINRLVHHSEMIGIEGEEHPKREAETKEATDTHRRKKRS